MILFSVDRYTDTLRERREREKFNGTDKHHYFDTLGEAHDFILMRAAGKVAQAERDLKNARKRHRKCILKFSKEGAGE